MNELDKRIQAALQGDDPGAEPNLAEEIISAFRGRHRWMHGLIVAISLAVTVVAVWAGLRFYQAEVVPEQLRWGGLALLALLMVSFLKVWFWLEMQSNRVLRELKRIELLLISAPGRD